MYGGSNGESGIARSADVLSTDYNGAFVACPDPVDFHAYMTADLYQQPNLFYLQGAHKQVERPGMQVPWARP